jgi:hypothetical protein
MTLSFNKRPLWAFCDLMIVNHTKSWLAFDCTLFTDIRVAATKIKSVKCLRILLL